MRISSVNSKLRHERESLTKNFSHRKRNNNTRFIKYKFERNI